MNQRTVLTVLWVALRILSLGLVPKRKAKAK